MATTFSNLLYHVVFSTKNRLPQIESDLQAPLYSTIGGIFRHEGGTLLAIGGMPDHIHLLFKGKTDTAVASLVRVVKSKSSRWVNEERDPGGRFEWQSGYGAFSVSESQVGVVRRYIQNQAAHHARLSFREELVELLQKHGIEFDERYLLG